MYIIYKLPINCSGGRYFNFSPNEVPVSMHLSIIGSGVTRSLVPACTVLQSSLWLGFIASIRNMLKE